MIYMRFQQYMRSQQYTRNCDHCKSAWLRDGFTSAPISNPGKYYTVSKSAIKTVWLCDTYAEHVRRMSNIYLDFAL